LKTRLALATRGFASHCFAKKREQAIRISGGVDGGSVGIGVATLADGIVGFERITMPIDLDVAVGPGLYVSVFLQLQPNR
jgi:hypothetical protein